MYNALQLKPCMSCHNKDLVMWKELLMIKKMTGEPGLKSKELSYVAN